MANPIARVAAAVRRQPALALAVGGVGIAAAVSVGRRRSEAPPPPAAAVSTAAAQPIAGYGPGLSAASPLDAVLGDPYAGERASATATITSAINAGNASIAEAIRQAIAAGGSGSVQPLPVTPAPVSPPPVEKPTPAPAPVPAPAPAPAPTPRIVSRATLAARAAASGPRWINYTVRPGDWLSKIAPRFGVPGGWQRLYADNRATIGPNPDLIRPGQVLRVYATTGY